MMRFTCHQDVLFRHCDPAGIVFYPRYFEMVNDCVELFFRDALNWPFEVVHKDGAVPTAHITVDFTAPTRQGDRLQIDLQITKLGRASMSYDFQATCQNELRLRGSSTLVYVGPNGRPQPWPQTVRQIVTDRKLETQ